MVGENISHKYRLKNIDETRNYFIGEINQNQLMSKEHKKVCTVLNYSKRLFFLASVVTRFVSISAFAFLVGVHVFSRHYKFCSRIKNLCNNCRN